MSQRMLDKIFGEAECGRCHGYYQGSVISSGPGPRGRSGGSGKEKQAEKESNRGGSEGRPVMPIRNGEIELAGSGLWYDRVRKQVRRCAMLFAQSAAFRCIIIQSHLGGYGLAGRQRHSRDGLARRRCLRASYRRWIRVSEPICGHYPRQHRFLAVGIIDSYWRGIPMFESSAMIDLGRTFPRRGPRDEYS